MKLTVLFVYLVDFRKMQLLHRRKRTVINQNAYVVMNPERVRSFGVDPTNQVQVAAWYLQRLASIHLALKKGQLDLANIETLYFNRFFSTCRIPSPVVDSIQQIEGARNVVVLRNNQIYSFNLIDEQDQVMSIPVIEGFLERVLKASLEHHALLEDTPSMLTTKDRDFWYNDRKELMQTPANAESLHKVEGSVVTLCLEDSLLKTAGDQMTEFIHTYGDNRWFDKSIQLIVCSDGVAGFNYEAACCDDYWTAGMVAALHQPDNYPTAPEVTNFADPAFELLSWDMDKAMRREITRAQVDLDALTSRLSVASFHTHLITPAFCQQHGVAPRSLIHLLQTLAYRMQYRKWPSHYSSTPTSHYQGGRSDGIRLSSEVVDALEVIFEKESATDAQREGLREATRRMEVDFHRGERGRGVDSHLLALRAMVLQDNNNNGQLPVVFKNRAFHRINTTDMHTLWWNNDHEDVLACGVGPRTDGWSGYGLGAVVSADGCRMDVTKYDASIDAYMHNLQRSADLIEALLK
jgi:carnitine O-acetyltransferase